MKRKRYTNEQITFALRQAESGTAVEAIRRMFGVVVDNTGNMPTPPAYLVGKDGKPRKSDSGVTNIRNPKSPHWRRWLGVESRCLVPFTSFAEPDNGTFGGRAPVWFAFDEARPLACFAGIWTRWTSVRKVKEDKTTNDIFGFLTINPNAEVGAIHPKAMPVILRTPEEMETWMMAPTAEALKLQRPLPDGALRIVAQGGKEDKPQPAATVGSTITASPQSTPSPRAGRA